VQSTGGSGAEQQSKTSIEWKSISVHAVLRQFVVDEARAPRWRVEIKKNIKELLCMQSTVSPVPGVKQGLLPKKWIWGQYLVKRLEQSITPYNPEAERRLH